MGLIRRSSLLLACTSRMAHHRTRSPPPPSLVNGWKKPTLLGTRLPERRYESTPPSDKRTMDTVQWSVQSHTGGTISSSAMSFVLVLLLVFPLFAKKKPKKKNQKIALSLSLPLSNVKRLVRVVYVCKARVDASTVAHVGLSL